MSSSDITIQPYSADLPKDPLNSDTEQQPHYIPNNAPTQTHRGTGTQSDPYIIEFHPNDPTNPQNFSPARKWLYVAITTFSVLAVTMTSSAYTGSALELTTHFAITSETYAAGIALFVLGFAVGPCLWAPLSELYGRRVWYIVTHAAAAAFIAGSAGARNVETLLMLRFLTGMFGASPLTNSGGVIVDLFKPAKRGTPMCLFAAAPFLGPTLGPVVGGFVSEKVGWRWVQGVMAIFMGVIWIVGSMLIPETYAPVILSRKAARLSKETGEVYRSVIEKDRGSVTFGEVFSRALRRPWALLFLEPIVLIASAYLSILYGTLYMFLAAFPIVYQDLRGWDEGIGGLAFLGQMIGMVFGIVYLLLDDVRYQKSPSPQPPEARLPAGCIGAVAIPIGMFSFAWTTYPSIHWSASIILSSIFGFGMVLVFIPVLNFIIDAYVIYAASALAATAMMRSFFGTAFPLFTSQMYDALGVHWASSLPAFLALACTPFPFLMLKYGAQIRMKCKYSKEAALLLARLQEKQ